MPVSYTHLSSALVTDYLRNTVGFQGVITSDSLSATALGGIQPSDLGVRLVEAGGDLACIGAFDYVQQVLDGLNAKAAADSAFADKMCIRDRANALPDSFM